MNQPPRLKRAALMTVATAVVCTSAFTFADDEDDYRPRPSHWAQPSEGHFDIKNFYKVDDFLFRGAQPEDEGFEELRNLGIHTVVDMRSRDHSEDGPSRNGIVEIDLPCRARTLNDEQTVAFLKVMADPERQPVFLHCRRGADRTGTLVAIYRIVFQGWSKSAAIEEMLEGGYHFADLFYMNLAEYIWNLDVDRVCAEAGVTPAPPSDIWPVDPNWPARLLDKLDFDEEDDEHVRRGWLSKFTGGVFMFVDRVARIVK